MKKAELDKGPSLIEKDMVSDNPLEVKPLWSLLHFSRSMFRRQFLLENRIVYPSLRRTEDPVYMARVLAQVKSLALTVQPVYLFHTRPRKREFSFVEVRDSFTGYLLISEELIKYGLRKIAFVFHGFLPTLQYDYQLFSDEQRLELASLLKHSLDNFTLAETDNPVFLECGFDVIALKHDLIVIKSFSPKGLAVLMEMGALCGMTRRRGHIIEQLKQENQNLKNELARNILSPLLKKAFKKTVSLFPQKQQKRY